jgi:S-(hydroxymethyl)glutathione dehydrogenase/alcohol dehydrogenase
MLSLPCNDKRRKPVVLQCKAAVLETPGQPLKIDVVDLAPLAPRDVLVEMRAASLCHTDLEVADGDLAYPMPIVLGHEAAGRIVEIGAAVDRKRLGESVVISWNPHCGQCFYCDDGHPILCDDYRREGPKGHQLDGRSRLSRNGRPVATMFFTAAFAEYAIVDATCAIGVPADMPADRACLLGCSVMTGVGATTRVAAVVPGECVVVIGCGAVGLAAVQGARLAGAETIVAIDLQPAKTALAMAVGATHAAVPDAALDLIRSLTGGRGADVVVESAGRAAGFRLSAEACRPAGRVVWLGKIGVDEDVPLRWGSLMGEKRFIRSSYGGARPQRDFPMLARAWRDGRLKLDELISRRLQLGDINSGLDALRRGEVIRSVIEF